MKPWPRRTTFSLLFACASLVAIGILWPGSSQKAPPQAAAQLPAFEAQVPMPLLEPSPKIIYKWRDESGAWHFGDELPADQLPATLTLVSPGPGASANAPLKPGAPAGATWEPES